MIDISVLDPTMAVEQKSRLISIRREFEECKRENARVSGYKVELPGR